MKRIAKFEKIEFEEFEKALKNLEPGLAENAKEIYANLRLPRRGTRLAAGYDFFAPFSIELKPNQTITIPSGVRCVMEDNFFLAICPRSGLGFKFRLQLNNTIGIIDADFINSESKGHILIKLTNRTNEDKTIYIDTGSGYAQGIFLEYALTYDDDVFTERTGGFGSTDTNK